MNGILKRMPNGFYNEIENQKILLNTYIIEECNNSRDIFLTKTSNDLKKAGLAGLLYFHKGGMATMIENVFGKEYAYPWELSNTPCNCWQGESGIFNARLSIKWFFQKYLDEDIEKVYSTTFTDFNKIGLGGMIQTVYRNSVYDAFMDTFPEQLQPWKFKRHPKDFWKTSEGKSVAYKGLINLLEIKFGKFDNLESILDKIVTLSEKDFKENDLYKVLKYYGQSHHNFIKTITKLNIKDYEWDKSSQGTWENSFLNCILVLKDFIDAHNLNSDEILLQLSKNDFPKHLKNMINIQFDGSPSKAIMALYPMRFEEWQFGKVQQNYWKSPEGKRKAIELTRDLIQNKLNYWSFEEIKNVSTLDFYKNGLSSIITKVYQGKLNDAIMAAYPGTFTKTDFDKKGKEEFKFINFIINLFPNYKYEIRKRYPWLRKSNNYMLELDLFFPDLYLAFEYQGMQHYIDKSEQFGRSYDYKTTRENDKLKRELCVKHGVTLIEIPYGFKLTIIKIKEMLTNNNRIDLLELIVY
ncbi:MAG: hypothetical protein EPN93_13910 [Spirochaetes bacterium]|nr:MAG: hypothetical protein EPN93_13910 [Spirochaetota bacterium]